MAERTPAQLDDFLCFAVYSANLAFARAYRPLLDPLGLTYIQYAVLVALWQRDQQLVGELGDRMFLASNTLTPLLKRLQKMGYVTRTRDRADERQVRIALTASGRKLQAQSCDVADGMLAATCLSVADLNKLQRSISKLRDDLLKSAGEATRPAARRALTTNKSEAARPVASRRKPAKRRA